MLEPKIQGERPLRAQQRIPDAQSPLASFQFRKALREGGSTKSVRGLGSDLAPRASKQIGDCQSAGIGIRRIQSLKLRNAFRIVHLKELAAETGDHLRLPVAQVDLILNEKGRAALTSLESSGYELRRAGFLLLFNPQKKQIVFAGLQVMLSTNDVNLPFEQRAIKRELKDTNL